MIDLNNLEEIKKLDPKNVYGSTEMFIAQCKQIHAIVEKADLTSYSQANFKNLSSLIFSGMGGSAYGGHIATSLFKDELPIPLYVNSDYGLPYFADCDSIVILTSYSGNTEETIASYVSAKNLNAKIIVLTSGGKLGELVSRKDEAIIFDPKHNPSGQPRLGTGYVVLGTIEILRKIGLLKITSDEVVQAIAEVEKNQNHIKSTALDLSKKIYGNVSVIFAGSIFGGNAHILRNQFNETAKSFSSFHIIPEANHHLLEGLKNPKDRKLVALFLDSALYDARNKKRIELTKDVLRQNKIPVFSYKALGASKLSQALNVLSFGGYLSLYLALLYGQDPSLIPWVDHFKEKLKSS